MLAASAALAGLLLLAAYMAPAASLHYHAWRYRKSFEFDGKPLEDVWAMDPRPRVAFEDTSGQEALDNVAVRLLAGGASPQFTKRMLGRPFEELKCRGGELVYFYQSSRGFSCWAGGSGWGRSTYGKILVFRDNRLIWASDCRYDCSNGLRAKGNGRKFEQIDRISLTYKLEDGTDCELTWKTKSVLSCNGIEGSSRGPLPVFRSGKGQDQPPLAGEQAGPGPLADILAEQ